MAMAPSNLYLVDPITGFAGEYRADRGTVHLFTPEVFNGQVLPVDVFVARNSCAQVLECGPAEFAYEAARLGDKATALDFFLMLFDSEVQDPTKEMVALELEKLFAHQGVRDYVLNIVYAAPLPDSAVTNFVTCKASSLNCLAKAQEFVASQDRIRTLFAVWAGMKSSPELTNVDHERLTGQLIAASFFRQTVLEVVSDEDPVRMIERFAHRLQQACGGVVLQEMLSGLRTHGIDVEGRTKIYESMIKDENTLEASTPASFEVLTNEIRELFLNLRPIKKGKII